MANYKWTDGTAWDYDSWSTGDVIYKAIIPDVTHIFTEYPTTWHSCAFMGWSPRGQWESSICSYTGGMGCVCKK